MSIIRLDHKLFAAISILLSALMILLLPAQKIAAAEEQPKAVYISEIRLGYGKTAEEAAKSLEGYEILKNGGNYADLNEGSGKDTVVLLGYKTTTDREEAVTDIAAMNMKGGYSFTEYELLMEQYRDSRITPFLNRFMKTVQEYRDNYNGENANNKAKAQYSHDLLNLFFDDDTGMKLGDLLLKETAEELGSDKYKTLSDEDRKKYGSLTTILMQGETSTVFMIEQLVTMAADTNENTWLQRLEGVTADSLLKEQMADGTGETDARAELARKYEDSARIIAEKWPSFRASLLDYDNSLRSEDGGVEIDPEDVPAADDDEEEAGNGQTPEEIINGLGAKEAVEALLQYTENQIETAEAVDGIKIAMSYNYLKNTQYDNGTMLDYFTRIDDDMVGNDYFELYPIVSVLTEGQIAGSEFMNLNQLVQYGAAVGEAYTEMNRQLGEYVKNVVPVSVYEGVNRELFSKGTALTDDEMRKKAANSTQLFGDSQSAALGRAGVFAAIGIASGFGAAFCVSKVMKVLAPSNVIRLEPSQVDTMNQFMDAVRRHRGYVDAFKAGNMDNMTLYASSYIQGAETYKTGEGRTILKLTIGSPYPEGEDFLNPQTFENRYVLPDGLTYDKTKDVISNADEISAKIGLGKDGASSLGKKAGALFKAGLGTIFSLAFLGLTVYSIYSSAMEIYNYYNVDMTKVPKYIVDRADLTETDENGNTVIRRNDSAYYEAAGSNRAESDKNYEMMKDSGDVNAGRGKQWLVLYVNRNTSVKSPVLADSLTVVTGKTDMPEGYTTGVHLFGESVAVNMTDKKYCYDDKLNGIYVYFKNEPVSSTSTGTGKDAQTNDNDDAPSTSSSFGFGFMAFAGIGGALAGFALGAYVAFLIKRKKASETVEKSDAAPK